MKTLVSVLSLVLATSSVQASTSSVKFVAQDSSVETSICLLAAEKGYLAAKTQSKNIIGSNNTFARMICNGVDIKSFAKAYNQPEVKTVKEVVLVPVNDTKETQLCIKAANNGVRSIGNIANSITCNGQSVARFVRSAI